MQAEEAQEVLGGGPGVFLYDASALPSRKLVAFVKETAAGASIPLQFDFITGYGEDGAVMQKTDGGAPIVNLVVPTRYTHAHNGIINRADFDRMVDLVTAMVTKLECAGGGTVAGFCAGAVTQPPHPVGDWQGRSPTSPYQGRNCVAGRSEPAV